MNQFFSGLCIFFISFTLFAQDKSEPIWWQMERDGEYLEAASFLLYKVQSDSSRNQHADYLHIARMYGYLNDYEKAKFYWKKSFELSDTDSDEQFQWYFKGTLAFFERDRDSLKKYYKLLESKHSPYYKNNYKLLKSLYENFDKGYLEASSWRN